MADLEIKVVKDTGTPAVEGVQRALSPSAIRRAVGSSCARLARAHVLALPPNANGWPSTRFWQGAARGINWEPTPDGVVISMDNASAPGAMRQQFHGAPIRMKDKMLTIPASAPFYGHSATEFTNLRLAILGGHPALVVGKGGVGRVSFQSGTEQRVKGAGARAATQVAYWLRESVGESGGWIGPSVIPSEPEFQDAALEAIVGLLQGRASE